MAFLFGEKNNKTRIIPVSLKIVLLFSFFMIFSNLASNYINLSLNRKELVDLMKQLVIKDLKEIYSFSNNQYELYEFNRDKELSIDNIKEKALREFKNKKSILVAVQPNGEFLLEASHFLPLKFFEDENSLKLMNQNLSKEILEGFLTLKYNQEEYFAVYRYNPKWNSFLIRGEEINEFYGPSRIIFRQVSFLILGLTLLVLIMGVYLLRHILRFLRIITKSIIKMNASQQLELINMEGASNDDITFLGVSFNSLSSTINNLVNIFRKFANKDVAIKAYRDREVKLEGSQKELTCLFSDIKSFTNMTETLGTDIITLLNLHYDQAIREIIDHEGIIGSIIGDALLAVYGVMNETGVNKSYQAVLSAYKIQDVASHLRKRMSEKREEILSTKGSLTQQEERVYKAVLIEVGVGIDGGIVFYGNIGSNERMTNTVIGDNVNSASRLEGLTRKYKVSVICSEYIKEDIQTSVPDHDLYFIELDTVQVKGKTQGKKVFWPILKNSLTPELEKEITIFSQGLQHYYEGNWATAYREFLQCSTLPMAEIFKTRTRGLKAPENWVGIWAMEEK